MDGLFGEKAIVACCEPPILSFEVAAIGQRQHSFAQKSGAGFLCKKVGRAVQCTLLHKLPGPHHPYLPTYLPAASECSAGVAHLRRISGHLR